MKNISSLSYQDATGYSSHQLAAILTACFEGYVIPFEMDGLTFAQRFGAEGLSLAESRIWCDGHTPIAIAMMVRRGMRCRLAAFSIHPEWRNKGLGKNLIAQLLKDAKQRGDSAMWLEVITTNPSAIALYERMGFHRHETVSGFLAPTAQDNTENSTALAPCDPSSILQLMVQQGGNTLPWMVDPLGTLSLPTVGISLNNKAFAIVATAFSHPQLRTLYVHPSERGRGYASQLLQQLALHFNMLSTPVAVPDTFAPLYQRNGWQPHPIQQFIMSHTFK